MRSTVIGWFCLLFLLANTNWLNAQAAPQILFGTISSDREGPMEGVLVSAKKTGSTITITVVSDSKGHYAFPADRLEPGAYRIAIRAAGYALESPDTITVAAGEPRAADLKLKPAPITPDQVTNAEWLTSAPGPDGLKRALLNCTDCHSLQRIFESSHTNDEFLQVFDRMAD
jgi:virginiamycin B lyase